MHVCMNFFINNLSIVPQLKLWFLHC